MENYFSEIYPLILPVGYDGKSPTSIKFWDEVKSLNGKVNGCEIVIDPTEFYLFVKNFLVEIPVNIRDVESVKSIWLTMQRLYLETGGKLNIVVSVGGE